MKIDTQLLLPTIPETFLDQVSHYEELLLPFPILDKHIKTLAKLDWESQSYRIYWMHESYSAFIDPTYYTMYQNPEKEMEFKIRLIHYQKIGIAVVRRKWTKLDFITRGE
jgi:hypothetical protein